MENRYVRYFGWSALNGLILAIAIAHRQDISTTGLFSTILKAINNFMPTQGYIWLQIGLFILGIGSLIFEGLIIWEEGWPTIMMVACSFLAFLFLVLGVAYSINFVQNAGLIFLFGGGILLAFLINAMS